VDHRGDRQALGAALGLSASARRVNEMRLCMDSIAGITWERLERDSAVTYPCEHEGDAGLSVIFTEHFRPRPAAPSWFPPI